MQGLRTSTTARRLACAVAGCAIAALAVWPVAAPAQGVGAKAAAGMSVGRTGPKPLRAPSSNLTASRSGPENSPWTAIPTSDDIQACLPDVDVAPAEKIVASCVVGTGGDLQKCRFSETKDKRMVGWAKCVLPKFTAKGRYAGSEVEVPIQFTDETADK